jgi:hypothetical protein
MNSSGQHNFEVRSRRPRQAVPPLLAAFTDAYLEDRHDRPEIAEDEWRCG